MVQQVPATEDYWSVLGLRPGSDGSSLKRAFRNQARRWHPDLNGNDPRAEEQFKLVNEAYAVLSDPARRDAWEAGLNFDEAGPEGGGDPFARGFPDFDDYLDQLFGERRRRTREPEQQVYPVDPPGEVSASPPPPPPVQATTDLETLVELSPEQALQGASLEIELQDGTAVEVKTPAMAGDGWRLRLAGVTPGGGDHFLHLRVCTPDGLRVDGLRVLLSLDLSPAEAALGCAVVVPTLRGPVKLTVPAGSSSGRLLRLRGRGMEWGGQRGDQLVEVRIVVPEELGEAEAALYQRLGQLARGPEHRQ
ncbi:DnaJ C-terminal domain-containing protein [Cyanobium sp. WAJ14-Wanaka]|uniref:DnaJ C-terminal domain-containing protein n=1 Tax=Cyanobium sp. WAJ14-Wanaka TaxID=2823725 RepID=UPI0020CCA655|nr:DnaJ C-terminal domain-containing protein [Cyanobium sp. WAJ14-Wanaka]MCP9774507.1 DnaJ domain-containing protein [Cyanobium sp. WAJ14-Wanaka]